MYKRQDLIRLAVDADVGGDNLARFLLHDVHDPAEVARLAQVLPVVVGEFEMCIRDRSCPRADRP